MKRGTLFAASLLLLLIIAPLVYAATTPVTAPTASNPFEKTISVPDNLQIAAKIIFGIKEDMSMEVLVTLFMIWLLIFMMIANILKLTPFFGGWKSLPAAVVITCLIALSGAIRSIAVYFIGFGNLFDFLEKWSAGALTFSVVLIIIIWVLISRIFSVFNVMKRGAELETAKQEGADIGAKLGFIASMKEMFKFTSKEQ